MIYNNPKWQEYRESIILRDGERCARCDRSRNFGAILQVHHLEYLPHKMPWEYPDHYCITLCKACHAEEHGKIPPRFGWSYIGFDDLGEDGGSNCEACGTEIRYQHWVRHEDWGMLSVGSVCCERMTDEVRASEIEHSYKSNMQKQFRFVESPRWRETKKGNWRIRHKGHLLICVSTLNRWRVCVMPNGMDRFVYGEKDFGSLAEAKKGAWRAFSYFEKKYSNKATAHASAKAGHHLSG